MSYGRTPLDDVVMEDIISAAQECTLCHARSEFMMIIVPFCHCISIFIGHQIVLTISINLCLTVISTTVTIDLDLRTLYCTYQNKIHAVFVPVCAHLE